MSTSEEPTGTGKDEGEGAKPVETTVTPSADGGTPVSEATTVTEAKPAPRSEPAAAPSSLSFAAAFSPRARRALWALVTVGALVGMIWLAVLAPTVSVPLLIAFIIAYLLDPVVDRFEKRGMSRAPAIAIILGAFLVVVSALLAILVPQIARELAQIPDALQQGLARVFPWIEQTFGVEVPHTFEQALATVQAELGAIDVEAFAEPAGRIVKGLYGGTLGALTALAAVVMIPVFAFYLLRDFDVIVKQIHDLIPARYRAPISARFREIDEAMSSFIRGQITVALILSALYSLGLIIAGLPLAIVVGLIAGLGNMVPYVGTAIGIALALALSLLSDNVGLTLLKVGIVFAVVQGLEGWVITPRVVGESIGLSPFLVIVAVLFFGELFGFVGVLIAVPLAAILKILLRVALEAYRSSTFYEQ